MDARAAMCCNGGVDAAMEAGAKATDARCGARRGKGSGLDGGAIRGGWRECGLVLCRSVDARQVRILELRCSSLFL